MKATRTAASRATAQAYFRPGLRSFVSSKPKQPVRRIVPVSKRALITRPVNVRLAKVAKAGEIWESKLPVIANK